ncbi:MAG: cytochrome c biogenesis protein, partial [Clostridia bacterium]|nr:cytochrome c biogenesis protein [Clostridia bacterium]
EYASGEFKSGVVDPFNAQFSNAQIWWDNFLQDFKIKEEKEIFIKLDKELLNKVVANKNFVYAVKYATGDSGIEKRIRNFQAKIHSPLFWWKKFAASMGVPQSMLEDKQYDDCNEGNIVIDRGMSYKLKKDVENNQYYRLAAQFAKKSIEQKNPDPVFEEHYKRFVDVYESSHSYYWLMLEDFGVNSDEEFLSTGFFRIGLGDEIKNNANYKIIRQKKDKQDNIILDDILAGIEYQTQQYQEAKKRWQAFINKLSCQNEKQLLACDLYIGEDPDFLKVKKYAEDSHVEEFIKQLVVTESKQRDAFDKRIERRKEEKKRRTGKIISGILIVIIPAVLLAIAAKYMTGWFNTIMEMLVDVDFIKISGNKTVTVDTLPSSLQFSYYTVIALGALSVLLESFRRKSGTKRFFRALGCVLATMFVLMTILTGEITSLLTFDRNIYIVTAVFGVFAILTMIPCLADTSFGCATATYAVSLIYQLYYFCYAHYFPNTLTIHWQNIVVLIVACFVMLTVLVANLGNSYAYVAWGILAPYAALFLFSISVMAFHSQLAGKFWPGAWSLVTLIATAATAGLAFFSMEAYGDLRSEIGLKKKMREERKQEKAALKKSKKSRG